jgi:hypothetical protein
VRSEVFPPDCLIAVYRLIYPTLDFSQVRYFTDDKLHAGEHPATTRHRRTGSEISIAPPLYDPCNNRKTFPHLLHELMHVLQRQSQGLVAQWTSSMVCELMQGKSQEAYQHGNCVEVEAKSFEDDWNNALDQAGLSLFTSTGPCQCEIHLGSWKDIWNAAAFLPETNQAFTDAVKGAIATDPNLVRRSAGCSGLDCVDGNLGRQLFGYGAFAGATAVSVAGTFWDESLPADIGTIVGGFAGAVGGAATGAAGGAALGGALGGGLGGAVGAGLGGFVGGLGGLAFGGLAGGFAGAVIGWLFGGGDDGLGGSLNLMVSIDDGHNFGQKVTLERSREQPALAFGDDRLVVGWTGRDSQLNVIVAPQKIKQTMEKAEAAGPALAFGDRRFYLAWNGADEHPNCMVSGDGANYGGKFTTESDTPMEATPGVTFGNGRTYVAWVGSDSHIRLVHLDAASNPLTEVPIAVHRLQQTTENSGTPALAFGDGRLFLAWSSLRSTGGAQGPNLLNVMEIPVAADGSLLPFDEEKNKVVLSDFTSPTTGPALAFSPRSRRLFLAFTGADDTIWVLSSTDHGKTFRRRLQLPEERSRTDAGPAIAAHTDGTIAVAWVGTDGD